MSQDSGNVQLASGVNYGWGSTESELAIFDKLPAILRYIIREAGIKIAAASVARYVGRNTTDEIIHSLFQLEKQELWLWANEYKRKHGHIYPHVAAQASTLRYGRIIPLPQHRPKPFVEPRSRRRRRKHDNFHHPLQNP